MVMKTKDTFYQDCYNSPTSGTLISAGSVQQSATFHGVTQNYYFSAFGEQTSTFSQIEPNYCKQDECSQKLVYYGQDTNIAYFYTENTNTPSAANSVTEIKAFVIETTGGTTSSQITVASGNPATRKDMQVKFIGNIGQMIVSWIEDSYKIQFTIVDVDTTNNILTLNGSFDQFGKTLYTSTTEIYTQQVDFFGQTDYIAIWSEYDGTNTEGYYQTFQQSDQSPVSDKVNLASFTGLAAVRGVVYPFDGIAIGTYNNGNYRLYYYNYNHQLTTNFLVLSGTHSSFTTDLQIQLLGEYIGIVLLNAGTGTYLRFYQIQSDSTLSQTHETEITGTNIELIGTSVHAQNTFTYDLYWLQENNSQNLELTSMSYSGCPSLCDPFSCGGIYNYLCVSCTGTGRITIPGDPQFCYCQPGYYSDKTSTNCITCTTPCPTCYTSGTDGCTGCDPSEFRVLDNLTYQCVCQDGYYEDIPNFGYICQVCSDRCATCQSTPDNCTSCGPNQSGQNCECDPGYEEDAQGNCQLIPNENDCKENQYLKYNGQCAFCDSFNPNRESLDCKCPANFHEENKQKLCVKDEVDPTIGKISNYVEGQSIATLALIIPLSLTSNMYMLLNVIDYSQMLFMLMYVNVELSPSYNSFLEAIADFQLPFLPNFFQLFLDFEDTYQLEDAPSKFSTQERYYTTFFLYNSGGAFSFIIFPTTFYIVVKLGIKIAKKQNLMRVKSILQKLLIKMEWNMFVEIIFIDFLNYIFAIFLQFYSFQNTAFVDIFNYVFWSFTGVFLIFYIFFQLNRVFKYTKTRNEQFRLKYENSWNGLDFSRKEAIVFNFYLLFRKITFAFVLVFLHDYPSSQMSILTIQNLSMILLMLETKPYKDKLQQGANIVTEVMFMYIQLQFLVYCNEYTCNSSQMDLYIISLVVMGLHFLVIIYNIGQELRSFMKKQVKYKTKDRKDEIGRRKNVTEKLLNMQIVEQLQEFEAKLEKKRKRRSTKRLSLQTGINAIKKNQVLPSAKNSVKKKKQESDDSDSSHESIIDDYNTRMEKYSFIKLARTLNILPKKLEYSNSPNKITKALNKGSGNMLKQVIMSRQFKNLTNNQAQNNNIQIQEQSQQKQQQLNVSFNPIKEDEELFNDQNSSLISHKLLQADKNINKSIINNNNQLESQISKNQLLPNKQLQDYQNKFNFQDSNLDISSLQQSANVSKLELIPNNKANQFQEEDLLDQAQNTTQKQNNINLSQNQNQIKNNEKDILQLNNDLPYSDRPLISSINNQKQQQPLLQQQSISNKQKRLKKNKNQKIKL
ncbi:Insulin-like growth factor binding protein, N-terminal [Pseudocohnilembus persalinus]|uniref:Insulin-like growth factor binding protein, N-terminal n=1 Tax=Pseudocohnilembus persalinus TaxID=266149 RepID=A0A0V0QVX9_PSEPJ|nr:Insulin-like growth factor binding protein, N-terminal [Pseudocohnilembus persalinus]|eukprot:KRX06537.1 Insulin-like growth factor binding protein, N-terminal [Pseudocohnilembus persalinus]